ncbi:MAG: TonB-dependent receptor [Caulobacteraceae bacterium]
MFFCTTALAFGSVALMFANTSYAQSQQDGPQATQVTPAVPAGGVPGQLASKPAEDTSAVSEIVVTGSRIARRDYVSESPIVTVGKSDIVTTGSVTVETVLDQMPQFSASASSASDTANNGQVEADLRGLGNNRTLVLLDGRRMQPSGLDGSVDLNTVPQALLDNVEVITGGASAVYGSDAIAGVVNFKLKQNFTGAEVDAQYGDTGHNDGQTSQLDLALGSNFDDDRGNVALGFDYTNRDPVYSYGRSFFNVSTLSGNLQTGVFKPSAGNLVSQTALNSYFAGDGAAAGAVRNTGSLGFNNDGSLFSVSPAVGYNGGGPLLVSANNAYDNNAGHIAYLQLPLTRYNIFAAGHYDLTPHIQLYLQGYDTNYTSHENIVSIAVGSLVGGQAPIPVPVSNPFIPASLAGLLASRPNPTAPFLFAKRLNELGAREEFDNWNVYQFVIGAKGDVPTKDWTWDVNLSQGQSSDAESESGYGSLSAITTLLQAPDGGKSICTGGYDPFGQTTLSASCSAYLARTIHQSLTQSQTDAEANLQGGLFSLPAGDLRFAIGADWRRQTYASTPDDEVEAGDIIALASTLPAQGSESVAEGYGELLAPIVRDLPFVKELNVDLAYRYSDYSISGSANTYKASLDWEATSWLRFRGGYSRAIRAPSLSELYTPATESSQTLTPGGLTGDPCDIRSTTRAATYPGAAQVAALCVAQGVPASLIGTYEDNAVELTQLSSGSVKLKPEIGDTYTAGLVLSPTFNNPWLQHTTLSIDYYDINLAGAIGAVTGLQVLANCYNYNGSNSTYSASNPYCQLIQRDPSTGVPFNVSAPLQNLGGYKVSGVDFQLDWRLALEDVGLPAWAGVVSTHVVASYLDTFDIQNAKGQPWNNYAGTIGNLQINNYDDAHPTWRGEATIGDQVGPVSAELHIRYIEGMSNAANVGTTANVPGVADREYFDFDATWRVTKKLTLLAGVINLADTQPPLVGKVVTSNLGVVGTTDVNTYDILGRRFYVRLSAKF